MEFKTIYFYIVGLLLLFGGSMFLDNSRTFPQLLAVLSIVLGSYITGYVTVYKRGNKQ